MTTKASQGGCLCGSIRYSVSAPVDKIVQCHCLDCQKASGTGASANAIIESSALTITQGEPRVYSGRAASGNLLHRAFCGDCGSPIYSRRESAPERTVLKVGSLDDNAGASVVMNIWMRSARPWMRIDPELPHYDQTRPA